MRLLFVPVLRTRRLETIKIDPSAGLLLPAATMNPQEELNELLARQEVLKQEFKDREGRV